MFEWQIPLKSIYREVIDFRLKENADNYIRAGWHPVMNTVELFRAQKAMYRYRVGWLRGASEPARPPIIDEGSPPRIQDFGPSENQN